MTDEEKTLLYAEKFRQMIRKKTVSTYFEKDFSRFFDFHELLRELFPHVFETCTCEVFGGSLLLKWQGEKSKKPRLFLCHHDVVEAEGRWEHEPFDGDIEDGKLWGRGTLDTKGGLFCMLQAAEELIGAGYVPKQDIYFESSCNEECDGAGAEAIAAALKERGVLFAYTLDEGGYILPDPVAGTGELFAMVGIAEKGCAELRFSAVSNGGHASRPGKNTPLVRLGKFMAEMEKKDPFISYCPPATKEMFARIARHAHGITRFFLTRSRWFLAHVLPVFAPDAAYLMKTTIAFTMAQGSEAPNSLPQEAWVAGNMRYSHHQGRDSSFEAVKRIAKKHGVKMEVTDPGVESRLSDYQNEAFLLIESGVTKFFPGVETVPYVMTAASDNRYMSKVSEACYGFIPFVISEEQLDSIHGIDENVDLKNLVPAVCFYQYLMKDGE